MRDCPRYGRWKRESSYDESETGRLMIWRHIPDPNNSELDEIAREYGFHPLHVEDCRHRNQNAKVEENTHYIFIVLKPLSVTDEECHLDVSDLDIFLGRDFLVSVQEGNDLNLPPIFDTLPQPGASTMPDQFLHQIMDRLVDTYLPILERFKDNIDELEDRVLEAPTPDTLQTIFSTKRSLIEMRRVVANMRDVAAHLQRTRDNWISAETYPFIRDVYDHLARNLDTIDIQRDLLTGALDIYLSSAAHQTNNVVKALTVLGTVALPALVISGFYGMNLQHLPGAESPHATWIVTLVMAATTACLLGLLRWLKWF